MLKNNRDLKDSEEEKEEWEDLPQKPSFEIEFENEHKF